MRRVASGRASHVNKKIFASSETYYLLWFGEIGDDKKQELMLVVAELKNLFIGRDWGG